MNLNENEKKELKTLYSKLDTLYKEKAKLEVFKKAREDKLKEEIAAVCEIKNKKGEIQAKLVKMPLISAIINELYKEKSNKKEAEFNLYEEYKNVLSKKRINEQYIYSFLESEDSLKENADFIKEVYKESVLLSKEILEALNALLKDTYKIYLNEELEKQGYEVKENKDDSKLLELKEILRTLIG